MNITELARILRINPQELKNLLLELGFSIGQKAIKVDNATAKKIIKNWPIYKKQLAEKKRLEEIKKQDEVLPKETRTITIPKTLTVRSFAEIAQIPVNRVLAELMKNGIFTSINEKIDFDTASIVGADINLDVQLIDHNDDNNKDDVDDKKLENILEKEDSKNLIPRPPVIVIMGHVDHGKTKLLDSIRKTDVISNEAGGITQHIGAYQVHRNDKLITFIDTPGHEAFTAMRSRGAKIADIAILVVAADDGVKPQTMESYKMIEAAKIPFLVAINKVDKASADVNKTKQELSSKLNITPEDWGGKTICVPISAKEGQGIEELLDMVLLLADTDVKNLKANPLSDAVGAVIESNVNKNSGPIATILIQNGTLRVGDQLCFNNIIYGKVKALKDYNGNSIKEAGPSTPVEILGLKTPPKVGDTLEVGEGQKMKIKKIKSTIKHDNEPIISENENNDDKAAKVNLIIKSDFLGSSEAIEESLLKLNNEKIKVKIVHKALGNITEGDIKRAEDSSTKILGFNVKISPTVETLARENKITVKTFSIIYDLIEYVREEMQLLVKPEFKRIDLGRLKVLSIFMTDNNSQIVGGKVLDGVIKNNSFIEVEREGSFVAQGKLIQLQTGKQDVSEVNKDEKCGLKYEGHPVIQEGDIISVYQEKKIINEV